MRKRKKRRVLSAAAVLAAILAAACVWYVNDYYHSGETVQEYLQSSATVAVREIPDGFFFDGPGEEDAFVFYPGAKVEYTAYAPLMKMLAEEGIDAFLVRMPANLAFLGMDKADAIMEDYTYTHWYVGGHSLGGAMAAAYASDRLGELSGLVLLAAYPTKSLQGEGFRALSLYGSEDTVLNLGKVEEGRAFMPEAYEEIRIDGANHAGFGCYGAQEGDGKARISARQQWEQTVGYITEMIFR